MLTGRRIGLVVPAYNEQGHLARVLNRVPAFVDQIIVVDDASMDATSQVALEHADHRVELRRHEKNLGVGAAIRTGYVRGMALGCDVLAVMAADDQMKPCELEAVLRPVTSGQADYCKGDRLSHPSVRTGMPKARWLGNHVLSWLTRIILGIQVNDTQCGFTAVSVDALRRIRLDRLWTGYGYPNDLLAHLAEQRLSIEEVTVTPVYADEQSGIGWRHALFVVPFVLLRAKARALQAKVDPQTETEAEGDDRACESVS